MHSGTAYFGTACDHSLSTAWYTPVLSPYEIVITLRIINLDQFTGTG